MLGLDYVDLQICSSLGEYLIQVSCSILTLHWHMFIAVVEERL